MTDKFHIKGIFEYQVFENDILIAEYRDDNKIVNSSFDIIVGALISGDTNFKLDMLKLGNGGVINNVLQQPNVLDLDLYSSQISLLSPNIIVEKLIDTYVKFQWTLNYDQGNGLGAMIYTEAGLFSTDGSTMFSRKTFPEIIKDNTKKIVVNWFLRYSF
jgi:hypothetical protein